MQTMKCVVIGGGIGGLCAAIALRARGFEVALYEQAAEIHEVGAGLTLWANAIKALRRLDVADAVTAAGARQIKGAILDWRGQRLSKTDPEAIEAQFGAPTIAIHATTPNLGQGACQAIESAVVLARCLSEQPDVAAAFRAYETERQPRTAWITTTSWQIGSAGQISNPLLCALRNAVVRLTPASVMVANLAKAAGYSVVSRPPK